MFGWLRRRRRRRIARRARLDADVWAGATALPVFGGLEPEALERLRVLAVLFLHEKRVEPAGGLQLDETARARLAALACLPVLELGLDWYDGFVSVVVHPSEFVVPDREEIDEAGVVHVGDDVLSGEAWERGPVVLAWDEVLDSGRGTGFNVVAHEFAHKLDGLDGVMNGRPPLHRGMRAEEWARVLQSAYDELGARLDRGERPWLDEYAAESPAEFFAVCSEMFFDVPERFAREHAEVYAQLAAFYRQDPARRLAARSPAGPSGADSAQ